MNEVDQAAKTVWDFMQLRQQPRPADVIIALGSHDLRVAEYAAELFKQGLAPWLLCSGGFGRSTKDRFKKTEAELFAETAAKAGVPLSNIIMETRSANTGQNAEFSRALLQKMGIQVRTAVLVHKPYMERRTFATFRKVWPELDFTVTSPNIEYQDYPNAEIDKDEFLHTMVGDFQRLTKYAEASFQIPQVIPRNVQDAFDELVRQGYNQHLL